MGHYLIHVTLARIEEGLILVANTGLMTLAIRMNLHYRGILEVAGLPTRYTFSSTRMVEVRILVASAW